MTFEMTPIQHHLSDTLLMAYATGQLPEAFSLVVATHVSLCDDCRAALAAYEALGGSLLDRDNGTAMAEGALEATLHRIRMDRPIGAAAPKRSDVPAPLADYIGGGLAAVKWRAIGMGARQAILPTDGSATVRLLSIPPGTAMPDHGHRGMELTLVLRGAFRDEGDRFGPGDVEVATEAVQHMPVADLGETCICLAATDAPLRFRGLLPRLLQPLFRI